MQCIVAAQLGAYLCRNILSVHSLSHRVTKRQHNKYNSLRRRTPLFLCLLDTLIMLTESRIMAVVVTHNDTILKKAFWLFTTGLAVGIGDEGLWVMFTSCVLVGFNKWEVPKNSTVTSKQTAMMGGLKLLTTVAKVVHVYLIIIGAWLPSSNSHNQSTTWRYCLYQPFIKAADCVSRWPRLVAQLAIGVYNLAENDLGCRVVQRKIDQQKEVVDLTRRPSVQRTWYELERLGTRFFLQKMKNISKQWLFTIWACPRPGVERSQNCRLRRLPAFFRSLDLTEWLDTPCDWSVPAPPPPFCWLSTECFLAGALTSLHGHLCFGEPSPRKDQSF
ncbi:hypothetical protein T4A_10857 [Trichinella pseudospiralis]|uniref:Uncharacterized protein n=1 Tax=Trichinella pseudospiralis TaxID=6337 RepID=A0A0V1DTW5_TRIPS|nr:hypothetical protein T4A_10857 [Trichinella pseudospiralis]